MTSMFDPDTFLDSFTEESNETERVLIPAKVYAAYIEDVGIRHGEKESGDPWVQLVLKWVIEDADVQAALNRDKVVLTDSLFVDLNEDGGIATGVNKNLQLGKLRKATGKNEGRFSPRDLVGARALVDVKHTVNKETGNVREEVKGYASMG